MVMRSSMFFEPVRQAGENGQFLIAILISPTLRKDEAGLRRRLDNTFGRADMGR